MGMKFFMKDRKDYVRFFQSAASQVGSFTTEHKVQRFGNYDIVTLKGTCRIDIVNG